MSNIITSSSQSTGFFSLNPEWEKVLAKEFKQPYFIKLKGFLDEEKRTQTIFPAENRIFEAFNRTPFSRVKAVIIGQDPYHRQGQANGLCFSVNDGVKTPPSLANIFKELKNDLGIAIPSNGNLEAWANNGVLLLNAILTVRSGLAGSHQNKGWEQFTDAAIKAISDFKEHVVFLLWGNYAQAKASLINEKKHLILKAAHPSPLARNKFQGCKHFSKTNSYLENHGIGLINWDPNPNPSNK